MTAIDNPLNTLKMLDTFGASLSKTLQRHMSPLEPSSQIFFPHSEILRLPRIRDPYRDYYEIFIKMAAGRLQLAKFHNLNKSKIICRCLCTKVNQNEERYRKRATKLIDKVLRVDHAGEYGADRIYAGQIAILGRKGSVGELVQVSYC